MGNACCSPKQHKEVWPAQSENYRRPTPVVEAPRKPLIAAAVRDTGYEPFVERDWGEENAVYLGEDTRNRPLFGQPIRQHGKIYFARIRIGATVTEMLDLPRVHVPITRISRHKGVLDELRRELVVTESSDTSEGEMNFL